MTKLRDKPCAILENQYYFLADACSGNMLDCRFRGMQRTPQKHRHTLEILSATWTCTIVYGVSFQFREQTAAFAETDSEK